MTGDRSFFGHPRGLSTLFFTEMWERFSYYGMRALLILFMTATSEEQFAAMAAADPTLTAPASGFGLGFDVARAGAIYGLYTAFVYLMALPGGWIADRVIGQRRAVLVGGILIAMGHFSMAIEGLPTFFLGLMLIVLGTGLLKPNISTMVGELYPPDQGARRDAGFSIFYMGINIGAFLAPLVCGALGQRVDWHLGFAAAGIGMVLGLIQYAFGGKYLGDAGMYPDVRDEQTLATQRRRMWMGVGALFLVVLGVYLADVDVVQLANAGTILIVSVALLYLVGVLMFGGLDAVERKRVMVIGVLFLAAAIFWAGFEQAGSSLNLVAEQLTDLDVAGWAMPASWLQSVNALFIIMLAPLFAGLWIWLSNRHLEPSSPLKFAFGLVFLGLGFVVMIFASARAAQGVLVSPMWLVVTYFLHTVGELTLSPVGLSAFTKLAPHRMVGQMMGIWFMATSLGNLIAGQIAGRIGAGEAAAGEISANAAMGTFTTVAIISIAAGILLALLSRPIRKLQGGVQ